MHSEYIVVDEANLKDLGRLGFNWPRLATSEVWDSSGMGAYAFALNAVNTILSHGSTARWNSFPLCGLSYLRFYKNARMQQ